jgi:hypothetical protein
MQNPEQSGQVFRFKADSHSGAKRTPVPEQSGHLFRAKADTCSGRKRTLFLPNLRHQFLNNKKDGQ